MPSEVRSGPLRVAPGVALRRHGYGGIVGTLDGWFDSSRGHQTDQDTLGRPLGPAKPGWCRSMARLPESLQGLRIEHHRRACTLYGR
jgi:hypothetical protein